MLTKDNQFLLTNSQNNVLILQLKQRNRRKPINEKKIQLVKQKAFSIKMYHHSPSNLKMSFAIHGHS